MGEKIDFEKWNDDNDKMKVVILTQRNNFELLNYLYFIIHSNEYRNNLKFKTCKLINLKWNEI